MRLASILPHRTAKPHPVVATPDGTWIDLAALAERPVARLEEAFAWITEHGPMLTERASKYWGHQFGPDEFSFLPPVIRPPSFRDFYAFEAHVKKSRARRGLDMVPAWYEIP